MAKRVKKFSTEVPAEQIEILEADLRQGWRVLITTSIVASVLAIVSAFFVGWLVLACVPFAFGLMFLLMVLDPMLRINVIRERQASNETE